MLSDLREILLRLSVDIRVGIKYVIDKQQLVVLDITEGGFKLNVVGCTSNNSGSPRNGDES